ncbi:hypothetical protein BDY21DRAFT_349937 [Lineolata rhizophorae]|uniref:CID domain-containing protein n=1 Tax=Lineolata rhizophorae TaxID=578093 RepID=A0A6A6NWL7_9PEZI|nr:hypothetical protein BDY21DRAFT_349937 [Lineolata rhizophorae]
MKRVHILYVLNELLHHAKNHETPPTTYATITGNLHPHVIDLVGLAVAAQPAKKKWPAKIKTLLSLWESCGYYSTQDIDKLREAADNAANPAPDASAVKLPVSEKDVSKNKASDGDAPRSLPEYHGDWSTPWYDMPAASFVARIVPGRKVALGHSKTKPLKMNAGPVLEEVKTTIKDISKYANASPEEDVVAATEVDGMGLYSEPGDATREMEGNNNYYGWSAEFSSLLARDYKSVAAFSWRNHHRGRSRSANRIPSRGPARERESRSRSSSRGYAGHKGRVSSYRRRSPSPRSSRSESSSDEGRRYFGRGRGRRYSDTRSRSPPHEYRDRRSRSRSSSFEHQPLAGRYRQDRPYYSRDAPRHRPYEGYMLQNPPPGHPPGPFPPMGGPAGFQQGSFPPGPGGPSIPPPPPPSFNGQWPPNPDQFAPNVGPQGSVGQFPPFGFRPPMPPPPPGHGALPPPGPPFPQAQHPGSGPPGQWAPPRPAYEGHNSAPWHQQRGGWSGRRR